MELAGDAPHLSRAVLEVERRGVDEQLLHNACRFGEQAADVEDELVRL
jgi:hypothetical protein